MSFPTVRTVITLRHAQDKDKVIWVTESDSAVYNAVNARIEAGQGDALVAFHRVIGMRVVEFSTQARNVVNVESQESN